MITITIVTKHENDRKAIAALLSKQDDFFITNIGKDGYDAFMSAKTCKPDIIIMDFCMDDIICPELAPLIKRHSPSTALIALCSHEDHNAISDAFKSGISGFLIKQEIYDHLISSIRSVYYGGLYISKPAGDRALNYMILQSNAGFAISRSMFSNTEQQIFYGIICGYTDREIAKNLNMSNGSLRNCISHAKKKTGLHNRTQMTAYALLLGIISIDKIKDSFNLIDR